MSQEKSVPASIIKMRDIAIDANYHYSNHDRYEGDSVVEDLIVFIRNNYSFLPQISDWQIMSYMGIALGRYLEGDHYDTYDEDQKAEQVFVVGLTMYFLTGALQSVVGCNGFSSQWHRYRFSTCWEYNKTMMSLLSHARGDFATNRDYSEPFTAASSWTKTRSVQIMYLSDGLIEPQVLTLDNALQRIFYDEIRQFDSASWSNIAKLGENLYEEVYGYLIEKIDRGETDF